MIKSTDDSVDPFPWFHTGWYASSVEDMPSIKMSMFTFRDQHKIFPSVVKTVVIDVVYYHPSRAQGDKPVHADQDVFAVDTFSESGVVIVPGRDHSPGEFE